MLRWLLIILLSSNALGAYYGSYMLLSDPSEKPFKWLTESSKGRLFSSFLIPDFILLLVNGLLPTVAAVGMITRKPQKPLPGSRFEAIPLELVSGSDCRYRTDDLDRRADRYAGVLEGLSHSGHLRHAGNSYYRVSAAARGAEGV
ncbi:MAG: hypothetical protein IPH16_17085 [Haliscomenobacter sp.]|nr:hypothetical protein [Haliscomenobacter sp.]